MADSEAYKQLQASLRGIRSLLSRVPEHACQTKVQHLKVQAYILLAHAAFEQYLEDLSRQVSLRAIQELDRSGSVTRALLALVSLEASAQVTNEGSRRRISLKAAGNLEAFAKEARNNLIRDINNNHGIRTKNQNSLLNPIGLDPETVDLPTSAALDAFGVKRGDIAHQVKMTTEETRNSILGETKMILDGLRIFDRYASGTTLVPTLMAPIAAR